MSTNALRPSAWGAARLGAILFGAALLTLACPPRQALSAPPAPPQAAATIDGDRAAMAAVEELLTRRDYSAAAQRLSDFLARSPASPYAPLARLKLAFADLKLKRYDEATKLLRSGSPESRKRVEIQLMLAEAEEGGAHPVEAFAALQEALTQAGERPVAALCKDRLRALGGRLSAADAATLAQRYPRGWAAGVVRLRQADLALQMGRTNDAQRLLESFRRDFPGSDLTPQAEALRVRLGGKPALKPTDAPVAPQTSGASSANGAARAAAAKNLDIYTIGVLVPQEGGFRSVGEKVLKGVEQAAGVFGPGGVRTMRLAVRDCGRNGESAAAGLRELVQQEGAQAVVALLGAAHAQAAGKEARRLKVPMLALCQDTKLPVGGGFVFRSFLTPRSQVQRLADFAKARGITRLAVFYPRDNYGREMASLMRQAAAKAKVGLVAEGSYDPTHSNVIEEIKDIRAVRRKGVSAPPAPAPGQPLYEAVFVPEAPSKALVMLPQFAYAGVRGVKFLGLNLWDDPRFAVAMTELNEEVYFVDGFQADLNDAMVKSFVEGYRQAFGEEPDYVAAQAYDNIRMIMGAVEGGANSREAIARALAATKDFSGATGHTSLDAGGEARKSLYVLTLSAGRITKAD